MRPNIKGAIFCTVGQAAFGVNDALIKLVMVRVPEPMAVFVRGIMVLPLLAGVAWWRKELQPLSSISKRDRKAVLLRTVGECSGTFCFLNALRHLPLATVTTIVLATPLLVTAGGALFFGDVVGWRRWWTVVIGFSGVVLVVRPTSEGINAWILIALLNPFLMTLRDLSTRAMRAVPSSLVALVTGAAITISHGVVALVSQDSVAPNVTELLLLGACSVLIAAAYFGNILMMRVGEASFVQPFRYTLLVWAALLGILLFNAWPDAWTICGGAVIAGCGIYSLHIERRTAREAAPPSERPTAALDPAAAGAAGTRTCCADSASLAHVEEVEQVGQRTAARPEATQPKQQPTCS